MSDNKDEIIDGQVIEEIPATSVTTEEPKMEETGIIRRQSNMKQEGTCEICGTLFKKARRTIQLYCSKTCRRNRKK